jgi:mannose-1-phosphate guanylyltransferase
MYEVDTQNELSELPKENILLEPLKKNTAPACAFTSMMIPEDKLILILRR